MTATGPQVTALRRSTRPCDHCVTAQHQAALAGRRVPEQRRAAVRISYPRGSDQADVYLCHPHLGDWRAARNRRGRPVRGLL
jgi:hypothetical protein